MARGFFFSADAGMFVLLSIVTMMLASHTAGYLLESLSAYARAHALRVKAESAINTLLLSGNWLCVEDNVPVPGCITRTVDKTEIGLDLPCSSPCISGCTETPPATGDVYVVDFNICLGANVETCTWQSCRLEVWK